MKGQKKKQNGITLIALVITIIIMLILSGVSLNAMVGDNGIISQAQKATYMQSCAVIEEWFQTKYADLVSQGYVNGEESEDTALELVKSAGYSNCFFHTSDGFCLKKALPVILDDGTETTQTYVFYLLKKEELPTELQNSIKGADNLESRDYRKFHNVYGITSDLRVYYCEDGLENILGLTLKDINADSPDIIYATDSSALALAVNGGKEAITNQGLKSIKILTIDSKEKLSVLNDFDKLINLTTVYFTNLSGDSKISTLSGISGAEKLNYVKFTNCTVDNYFDLGNVSGLNSLYLVRPPLKNDEISNLCNPTTGIGSAEFSNLENFGIVGNDFYIPSTTKNYRGDRYGITNISEVKDASGSVIQYGLDSLTTTTKESIQYIYLNNNQIKSISCLKDFKNIYTLRMECNCLETLDGIQNMSNLHYLIFMSQWTDAVTPNIYTLGKGEKTEIQSDDALSYIYKIPAGQTDAGKNTSLYYVDGRENRALKHVEGLGNCSNIHFLYLENCNNIVSATSIADSIANCGTNYSLPGGLTKDIATNASSCLNYSGQTFSIADFEAIESENLTHLNLSNIKIKDGSTELSKTTSPTFDEEVNKVLKKCPNLKYLSLSGLSNLTSIDFVSVGNCTNIIELDLIGTGVTDLSNLNANALELRTLELNNKDIVISDIVPTINRCRRTRDEDDLSTDPVQYWRANFYGICLYDWSLWEKLEGLSGLTNLEYYYPWTTFSSGKTLDLSGTSLKKVWAVLQLADWTLPNTIEYIKTDYCKNPIFSANSNNLTYIELADDKGLASKEEWTATITSMANCHNLKTLKFGTNLYMDLNDLSKLKDITTLTEFYYYWWTDQVDERTDLGGVKDLTHLQVLDVYMHKLNDISTLGNLTDLREVNIRKGLLRDISVMENWNKLTKLELPENQINDIYVLRDKMQLSELNLENNSITNNSNHNGIGYDVIDLFYDLNTKGSLKELYIKGNPVDDTELLEDISWNYDEENEVFLVSGFDAKIKNN